MTKISVMALMALSLAMAGCAAKNDAFAKEDKPVYSIPVPLA